VKRIYHTWDRWECYPAGFYNNRPPKGMTSEQAELAYRDFLRDSLRFGLALATVCSEWKHSCEHYLTTESMNRIAWLGQAAMCVATGVPSQFRGGYNLLTPDEQVAADALALQYLNAWLSAHAAETLTLETAASKTVANLY